MNLGSSLSAARRKSGLSKEAVAEKLGVSRQTVSKWETDESLPDIRQSKRLAQLLDRLKGDYGYSELDAMLVLKDILARVWQERKKG